MTETEIRELEIEQLRRIEHEKYRDYIPIGKTEKFLDKFGSLDYLVGLYSAANGVGKTASLCNVVAHLCFPCGNPYFQQPLFTRFPYPKHIRIASDTETIHGTTIPSLKEWLPRGRYKTTKRGKNYEALFTTDTGFTIDILTYEQSPKQFESANVGLILLDEPPPESIFKACIARTRTGGMLGIFATPLTGSAWMFDQLMYEDEKALEDAYRFMIMADMEDACIDHGVRGFLKHENIKRIVAQYTDDDMQARVFGKPQHLLGMIFKMWNREVHVIDPFEIKRDDFVVIHALDTHPRVKEAGLWVARDRQGDWYVIDELWEDADTEQLATLIKQKNSMYPVVDMLLEPGAFNEDKHNPGTSLAKDYAKHGLNYRPGSKQRTAAIAKIKKMLTYEQSQDKMVRPPRLYVFRNCQRLVWEIEHYKWQEFKGITAEDKDPKGVPVDKDDHLIEDLGRIVLEEPNFFFFEQPVEDERYEDPIEDIY